MNPYEELGVGPDATDKEIRDAFKRLAKEHHPDLNGGDDERFKPIKAAYDLLTDPKTKKDYDDFGIVPGDQASQLRKRAMAECTRLFGAVLEEADPDKLHRVDLIGIMSAMAMQELEGHERNVKDLDALAKRYRKALKVIQKRMKRKETMKRDIFAMSLEQNIAKVDGAKAQARMHVDLWKEVMDVLTDHEFDFEKESASSTAATHSGFFTIRIG